MANLKTDWKPLFVNALALKDPTPYLGDLAEVIEKMIAIEYALRELAHSADEAGAGLAAWFAALPSSKFRHLGEATEAIRAQVSDVRWSWDSARKSVIGPIWYRPLSQNEARAQHLDRCLRRCDRRGVPGERGATTVCGVDVDARSVEPDVPGGSARRVEGRDVAAERADELAGLAELVPQRLPRGARLVLERAPTASRGRGDQMTPRPSRLSAGSHQQAMLALG